MPENEPAPKVFISYSWSSEPHKAWVVELAERLMSDGVEVILDVWDLKAGQDKYAFMERMVTDESVTRVLMVLDKKYADKADIRAGGVGSESQIISSQLYEKVDHQKFIPIVAERAPDGGHFAPVFLKSRIYIDLSSKEGYATEYEGLIRNIYDRPARQRPALGNRPVFLDVPNPVSPNVRFRLDDLTSAIEKGQPQALGHLKRFLNEVLKAMEPFRIEGESEVPLDERVVDSLRQLKPLRDNFIQACATISTFSEDISFFKEIHSFFERGATLLFRPKDRITHHEGWTDNFGFFLRECLLYLTALLLKDKRYSNLKWLIEADYCYATANETECESFAVFDCRLEVIDKLRNHRLKLNRLSVTADLIKERADTHSISFDELMHADVVLALVPLLNGHPEAFGRHWWPRTAVFLERHSATLPVFARIARRAPDPAIEVLFGAKSLDELGARYKQAAKTYNFERWFFGFQAIPFSQWMGLTDWLRNNP